MTQFRPGLRKSVMAIIATDERVARLHEASASQLLIESSVIVGNLDALARQSAAEQD